MSNIDIEKKLKKIFEKSKNSPQQRTEEWRLYRNIRIGGSEMHHICKLKPSNITSFINNFLYDKVDKKKMFMPPCEFGILFENEIHKYSEVKYDTKIYDIGVIQYDKIKSVCYSPDGVSIINNKMILFEFKCPYTRIPSNKIKIEYQCQINTGLNVIRECEKCYYCEGEFKKCKIDDLYNYTTFDTEFHDNLFNRDFNKLYATYGLIYIYESNDNDNNTIIDIGKCKKHQFINILNGLYTKKYKIVYFSDLIDNNKIKNEIMVEYKHMLPYNNNRQLPNETLIKTLQKIYENYINELKGKTVGFLSWKLYNYDTIIHEKKNDFFDDKMVSILVYIGYILNYTQTIKTIENKKEYILKHQQDIINML
jgi:hypothetical protein